jgi:hypothetical protein
MAACVRATCVAGLWEALQLLLLRRLNDVPEPDSSLMNL